MKAQLHSACLMLALALMALGTARADIKASLDASQIAVGDTVRFTLEHDGRVSGQPDLAPLQQSFDILGTSSSTMIELVNGSASEKTQVVLTLAAKRTGRLTIPSLTWGGERSQPLTLSVAGPDGAAQSGDAPAQSAPNVFMEASVSPEQPCVQITPAMRRDRLRPLLPLASSCQAAMWWRSRWDPTRPAPPSATAALTRSSPVTTSCFPCTAAS